MERLEEIEAAARGLVARLLDYYGGSAWTMPALFQGAVQGLQGILDIQAALAAEEGKNGA